MGIGLKDIKAKYKELFVVEKSPEEKNRPRDIKKSLHDFWYGKPHEERRLGDLYVGNTGLYKHREWRGVKDTMYYFNMIWLYNYAHMVSDIVKYGDGPMGIVDFAKGIMRYRWMGQTYLTVMHWFDRGLEGVRDDALRASAWHYRAMVSESIRQIIRMFQSDKKLNGGKTPDKWNYNIAHNETVSGSIFYPFRDILEDIPLEMIPYFVSVHVNNHTVLNYIDAAQSIGLPADPCPMCQAEYGLFVLDDYPDYSPVMVTSNEACDGSVATSVLQDWFLNRPLYAMPQPMRYDDPLVQKHCQKEIEGCWRFIEEHFGIKFDWDQYVKYAQSFNKLTEFEWEKWDVAAKTDSYPITSVAQALYRIYYSQDGDRPIWHEIDDRVKRIMNKTVKNKIRTFPKTRHRAIAWSCAPLYYSHWCTWAYNCWGINCIINMDSLMFDQYLRTDTYEHALEDLGLYNEKAPMRAMAVGGHEHILSLFDYMERFNCDMVIMYDQLQCKGMQGIHGVFEDEFRKRDIHAIWVPHALPDKRTVSRAEIRGIINDYMTTVMREEPLDPTLLDFDDSNSW
ncbi:MAG: 2-hydroxyacyl-CoA dehydratase family protein [Butyrivibrio sp.]|nr:2-hydroxyacyl-CoA dehydratase family protein [Butyrivibrio sp.]